MANYFFYERISTSIEKGLQKFNRQDKAIERYAEENNIEYVFGVKEDVSGCSFDNRKEWKKLEKIMQSGDYCVFKDLSRFSRETENGYEKYMELLNKGIELIFIDNPTVSTPYIKSMMNIAEQQNIVTRTALESTIKLLLIVELNRNETEAELTRKRIIDGIKASPKKSGRPTHSIYKLSDELKEDIKNYNTNRTIKLCDLMKKYDISRNTLKKYIALVSAE